MSIVFFTIIKVETNLCTLRKCLRKSASNNNDNNNNKEVQKHSIKYYICG